MADMLSQLFEYARIEAGELKLELEVFSASNVFAETIALFYEDFVKAGFEPRVVISNEPCYIEADKRAFIRIIENRMKNALVHGTGGYRISFLREDNKAVFRQGAFLYNDFFLCYNNYQYFKRPIRQGGKKCSSIPIKETGIY